MSQKRKKLLSLLLLLGVFTTSCTNPVTPNKEKKVVSKADTESVDNVDRFIKKETLDQFSKYPEEIRVLLKKISDISGSADATGIVNVLFQAAGTTYDCSTLSDKELYRKFTYLIKTFSDVIETALEARKVSAPDKDIVIYFQGAGSSGIIYTTTIGDNTTIKTIGDSTTTTTNINSKIIYGGKKVNNFYELHSEFGNGINNLAISPYLEIIIPSDNPSVKNNTPVKQDSFKLSVDIKGLKSGTSFTVITNSDTKDSPASLSLSMDKDGKYSVTGSNTSRISSVEIGGKVTNFNTTTPVLKPSEKTIVLNENTPSSINDILPNTKITFKVYQVPAITKKLTLSNIEISNKDTTNKDTTNKDITNQIKYGSKAKGFSCVTAINS